MTYKFFLRMSTVLVLFICLTFSVEAMGYEDSDIVGQLPLLLRSEEKNFEETGTNQLSMGSAVADGAILVSDADIALIATDDLGGNLIAGEVTWEDIVNSVSDNELMIVEITPHELKEYLEVGLSHLIVDTETFKIDKETSAFGGFPQVGGFTYRANASFPIGSRIEQITLTDGEKLDLDDTLTTLILVTTEAVLGGTYDYPTKKGKTVGFTEQDALVAIIQSGVLTSNYSNETRLDLIGHADDTLAGHYNLGLLAVVAIVIVLMLSRSKEEFLNRLGSRGLYD